MASMTGGEALVDGLVAHGVDTVFGLPGAQIYGVFDAFARAQLRVVGARHEQACGYMAFGDAPTMVSRAFQEMRSGRTGPVALEMPWDIFTQRADTGAAKPFDLFPAPPPDSDRIKAAAAAIAAAKNPMIFVGGGAIHAGAE